MNNLKTVGKPVDLGLMDFVLVGITTPYILASKNGKFRTGTESHEIGGERNIFLHPQAIP